MHFHVAYPSFLPPSLPLQMVSLLVVTALVFVYNKLMDFVPKHQLFYYVGLFYFCTFSCIAYMLASPTYGLANTKADPSRLLGTSLLLTLPSV